MRRYSSKVRNHLTKGELKIEISFNINIKTCLLIVYDSVAFGSKTSLDVSSTTRSKIVSLITEQNMRVRHCVSVLTGHGQHLNRNDDNQSELEDDNASRTIVDWINSDPIMVALS